MPLWTEDNETEWAGNGEMFAASGHILSLITNNLPARMSRTIDNVRNTLDSRCCIGITGSVRYSFGRAFNDVDLICVVREESDTPDVGYLLRHWGFDTSGWSEFIELEAQNEAHVFGCWHGICNEVRIEVLSCGMMSRICSREEFLIRRVRRGPLQPKVCTLNGTNGTKRFFQIRPESLGPAKYSAVPNVLISSGQLFVGMHLERILLAHFVEPGHDVNSYLENGWAMLRPFVEDAIRPANTHRTLVAPEDIFFSAQQFCAEFRMDVRSRLGGPTVA